MTVNKEQALVICNAILVSQLGKSLAAKWWYSRNRAFNKLTPEEQWKTSWQTVYDYLMRIALR